MATSHSTHSTHGVHQPHILPIKVYWGVWAALIVLTAVTVAVSQFDFGEGNLIIAMLVAITKGSLVALFFMHLLYENKLNMVIFFSSLVFMTIFFFLTFSDTSTRGKLDPKQGSFKVDLGAKVELPEGAKAAR